VKLIGRERTEIGPFAAFQPSLQSFIVLPGNQHTQENTMHHHDDEVTNPDPILSVRQAAEYTSTPFRTLNNMRCQQTGPAYLKKGHRIGYRKSALDRWLKECEVVF